MNDRTATKSVSTSSGSKMKAWKNPTISRIPDVLAQEIVADPEAQTIPVTLGAAVASPLCGAGGQDVLVSYFM